MVPTNHAAILYIWDQKFLLLGIYIFPLSYMIFLLGEDAFARIKSSKRRLAIISSVSTIGIILLSIVLTCILKKKKQLKRKGNNSYYLYHSI